MRISVATSDGMANVRFQDSGPGIEEPQHLFEPFQSRADGAGLGLYVSRALVRSYGGDLQFDPQAHGDCFRVEIPVIEGRRS